MTKPSRICTLYLRTYPEMVQSRARHRAHPEEKGLDLGLLQSLHKLHDEWLLQLGIREQVLVVCADNYPDLEEVSSHILSLLKHKC